MFNFNRDINDKYTIINTTDIIIINPTLLLGIICLLMLDINEMCLL